MIECAGESGAVDRLANISTTGALLKETYNRLIDDCGHDIVSWIGVVRREECRTLVL